MENRKTRIGVLGIGGIGGFVGGLLAKHFQGNPEVEIIFICRGETLKAISENGLKIIGKNETFVASPNLTSNDPLMIGKLDVLIIATKTFSLGGVLKEYSSTIGENTIILPLQNSVIAKEQILQQIPDRGKVLEGCIYVASNVQSPGIIQHLGGPGKIFFGTDEIGPYLWLEKLLQDAQVQAQLVPDIQQVLWSKFIFVAPIAAITTAYGFTFGQLISSKEQRSQVEKLMEEIKHLALVKGIILRESIIQESLSLIQQFPFETKSSLQLDFEKGYSTELYALVEYVIEESKKQNLDPVAFQEVFRMIGKNNKASRLI